MTPWDGTPLAPFEALLVLPRWEAQTETWALAPMLPDATQVPGALVVLFPTASRASGLARWFDRRSCPRAVRGSALLLAGYGQIEGGVEPVSGLDLLWGYAP